MPCVYILQFENGRYYIGSTNDLERRLRQHESGHTPSTKRMGKGIIVFSQAYKTLTEARSIESKLKSLKKHNYIAKIIEDGYIKVAA